MQILVMTKKSKYFTVPCSKCGSRIRQGRQYVLDPERHGGMAHRKPVPLVYHRVCYEQVGRQR